MDFWNVKKFPGPRGLFASTGKYNIQLALVAAGVAHKEIWPLTDDKLERTFENLNEIKPHISKWWSAGGEAPQLLINGEYTMSSVYDGRVIAAIRHGAPIRFIWDGAVLTYDYAARLKGGANTANAQKLIAFLNRAQIAAGWTQGTRYPGPNTNQLKVLASRSDPAGQRESGERFEVLTRRLCLARSETPGRQNQCRLHPGALARVAGSIASIVLDEHQTSVGRQLAGPGAGLPRVVRKQIRYDDLCRAACCGSVA